MSEPLATSIRARAGEALMRVGIVVLRGLALLPYGWLVRLGDALGTLLYGLAWPRRRIAQVNLALCFPHWSEAERRRIARAHFRAFTRSFLDRFILWYAPRERIVELCRLEGLQHFLEPVNTGRPVIVLAPHFVGIDAGGIRLLLEHPRLASMYARQKSAVLNDAMTRGRSRFQGTMLLRNEGLRPAVRWLRDGGAFYFLPDMDLGARDALFVPFFGVSAATVTSVARLARLTGAVVVPLVTRMTDRGYVGVFHPGWTDYPVDDLDAATRQMNAFIEARVLDMPEQYLWTHRRFKTRPPGEASPYDRR
ncbi:MAG: Lipid biosynthesis lauroyl acyltransferase [Pseudomonadota bacterium]|jgi:KDO2-lipid IV(A) lauroyltransferase